MTIGHVHAPSEPSIAHTIELAQRVPYNHFYAPPPPWWWAG